MRDETRRNLRVGALAAAAMVVMAAAILTIGQRQQLFVRHTRYSTTFRNVAGLQQGAQVSLHGVTVGFVERVDLPTGPEDQRIRIRFTVDADYTERIREDTTVQIKTIGLLGDKYLELRGGSPDRPRVLEGGLVQGKDLAEVEELVDRGEDVVANVLAISSSLKVILRRVEGGEGLIGEMTTDPGTGGKVLANFNDTVTAFRRLVESVERGEGLLGRMVGDEEFARQLVADLTATSEASRRVAGALATDLERSGTVYAALVRDPAGERLVLDALSALRDGSRALAAVAEELESGEGTLPRLLQDREFADDFLTDLAGLVRCLHAVAAKLDRGDGSAGAFLNDPQLYQDLENVVRGVESSKVTSWFVRNRREKGEELAAAEQVAAPPAVATPAGGDGGVPSCGPATPPAR